MDHSKVEAKLADIAVFIEEAEKAAYARGFQDALDKMAAERQDITDKLTALSLQIKEAIAGAYHFKGSPAELIVSRHQKVANKQEPKEGSDQAQVLNDIREHPGSRGFEVVKRLEGRVHERTIRTSIHRLKMRGAISKQGDKWFPETITPDSSREGQTLPASGPLFGGMAERPIAADSKSVGGS
jgi:hypothetical protein